MKFVLFITVIVVGIFIFLIVMMMNPFQTEVANATINESTLAGNFDGYTEMVTFWPFIPIILFGTLLGYAVYKVVKH